MKKNYIFKKTNLSAIVVLLITNMTFSQIYINELVANTSSIGSPTVNNEYVELRGTPSATIPAGTYLLRIDGLTKGIARNIFDLSGYTFGSNGFLVLAQDTNPYAPYVDPNATFITPTVCCGFGDLLFPGTANSLYAESFSMILISSPIVPIANADYDADDNGVLDGDATSWTVLDALGCTHGGSYGPYAVYGGGIYFLHTGANIYSGGTVVSHSSSNLRYFARVGNSTGSSASDWVAGNTTSFIPNYAFSTNATDVVPSTFSGVAINTLGSENYDPTLSSNEFTKELISLYPNPTSSKLFLKGVKENTQIKIFDITGKLIKKVDILANTTKEIDIQELQSGIYFMNFNTFSKTYKFIKD